MPKYWLFTFSLFLYFTININAQKPQDSTKSVLDSLHSKKLLKQIGNGFFPTKLWNFDLRYLIKFNQYEGLRTGIGGITNDGFSEKYRIDSYLVYGFRDHRFKYKIGGGFRVNEKTKTWINLYYNDDLQETGSSTFLTDGRTFSFFEPRLLNIELFHKHITKAISVEHEITPNLYTETEFSVSNINPTYNYSFVTNNKTYKEFETSIAKVSLQWNPFDRYETKNETIKKTKEGFPKFSFQYTKNFKNILNSAFNFSKIDFRTIHKIKYNEVSYTIATLSSGIANGDTPLTHLYHAYPNNNTKQTILQRFSVAGINSFETMYFNEFFSDKYATLVLKHYVKPFNISEKFKPQLVLTTRYAIGNMRNKNKHQGLYFNTLNDGYTESGFEINKLFLGFGLSGTYRYGAYHLPKLEDNIALKFTFNITL